MNDSLHRYSDIHTHDKSKATDGSCVVNIEPGETMLPEGHYSIGIHPWSTTEAITLSSLKQLVAAANDNRVKAIGETGFDRLHGGNMEIQKSLFKFHARLAKKLEKPLVIHCVRAWDVLLEAAKEMHPTEGSWIIHGFRGKPALALQLLNAGMALSYGEKYNAESMKITPQDRLYRETDANT